MGNKLSHQDCFFIYLLYQTLLVTTQQLRKNVPPIINAWYPNLTIKIAWIDHIFLPRAPILIKRSGNESAELDRLNDTTIQLSNQINSLIDKHHPQIAFISNPNPNQSIKVHKSHLSVTCESTHFKTTLRRNSIKIHSRNELVSKLLYEWTRLEITINHLTNGDWVTRQSNTFLHSPHSALLYLKPDFHNASIGIQSIQNEYWEAFRSIHRIAFQSQTNFWITKLLNEWVCCVHRQQTCNTRIQSVPTAHSTPN